MAVGLMLESKSSFIARIPPSKDSSISMVHGMQPISCVA